MTLRTIDSQRSASSVAACVTAFLALSIGESTQAQTAVFIDSNDFELSEFSGDATANRGSHWFNTIMQIDGHNLSQIVEPLTEPVVVLQAHEVPDVEGMNEILHNLANWTNPATYMAFVESADNYNWTSELIRSPNVKIAIAVLSQDKATIANIYNSIDSNYDGANAGYDYYQAVNLAVEQLNAHIRGYQDTSTIKPWAADLSDMFFDANVLITGAPDEEASILINHFNSEYSFRDVDWNDVSRVQNGDVLFRMTHGDMSSILATRLLTECKGDPKWGALIDNNIGFQSFGTHSD